MQIHGSIRQQSNSGDMRGAARWDIRLEVPGSTEDGHTNLVIHDISTAGMLIEAKPQLQIGQAISVSLAGEASIVARVVWQNAPLFGCRFDQPLAQATLSAIRLRHPVNHPLSPGDRPAMASAPEALPARLRRLRLEQGLSRKALSQRTGISTTTIWSWEKGKSSPRYTNTLILAEALGVTHSQLHQGNVKRDAEREQLASSGAHNNSISDAVDQAKSLIAEKLGLERSRISIWIEF